MRLRSTFYPFYSDYFKIKEYIKMSLVNILAKSEREDNKIVAYRKAVEAADIATNHDLDFEYAKAQFQQAKILIKLGDFTGAMKKNVKALEYFEDSNYPMIEAHCWDNMGFIYNYLGEHDKRLIYNSKCYRLVENSDDHHFVLRVLNNLGDTYMSLKDYDKALQYFESNYYDSDGFPSIKCISLLNIGEVHYHTGDYDNSIKFLEEAIEHATQYKLIYIIGLASLYLGRAYKIKGDLSIALTHLSKANDVLTTFPMHKQSRLKALELIAEIQEKMGELQLALNYFKKATVLDKEISEDIKKQTIKNIQFSFEIRAVELEKNKLKETNLELQKATQKIEEQNYALEFKSKQLSALNSNLKNFAHSISHDLKEPARMIASFSELLKKDLLVSNTEFNHEYLEFVMNSSKRLIKFIDSVLAFAKFGIDESILPPNFVNCNDIIQDILATHNLIIKENEAEIKVDHLPTIFSHKTLITRVFQNLIENSIKYKRKGVPPIIEISAKRQDDYYWFSVKDNGIGITKEDIPKIFTLFSQISNKKAGSGIGLSVVQKIIIQLNGFLDVESQVGEGTTVFFSIPIRTPEGS